LIEIVAVGALEKIEVREVRFVPAGEEVEDRVATVET